MDNRMFMTLYLRHQEFLKAYLYSVTGDETEMEDLLQNVSVVLLEQFERYDSGRPFRAWALGIARLEVLKWRQRVRRSKLVLSESAVNLLTDAAEGIPERADQRQDHLSTCIQRLASHARQVVELRYAQGLAIEEVARKTKKKIGAIEMTLVRVRRALRSCVERLESGVGETASWIKSKTC